MILEKNIAEIKGKIDIVVPPNSLSNTLLFHAFSVIVTFMDDNEGTC